MKTFFQEILRASYYSTNFTYNKYEFLTKIQTMSFYFNNGQIFLISKKECKFFLKNVNIEKIFNFTKKEWQKTKNNKMPCFLGNIFDCLDIVESEWKNSLKK